MAFTKAVSLVLVLWVAFLVNSISPLDFRILGVIPRDPWGLPGIALMPLLHRDFGHLIGNSIGLLVMLTVLYGCIRNPDRVSVAMVRIILVSGTLLWIFGRSMNADGYTMVHIGASGLLYGLVTFAVCCSLWTKNLSLFVASFLVVAYTGMSLFEGMLPFNAGNISWDGHFFGALAGCIVASMDHKELTQSPTKGELT